ncbi:MAG: sugar transferase [Clostridiales bacterium]|jgi:lipopolysaccharide/colanic/teichoic acid biosynthesis glycosyltransferase|nr:sugar transferase [Clostridiales bacterium]
MTSEESYNSTTQLQSLKEFTKQQTKPPLHTSRRQKRRALFAKRAIDIAASLLGLAILSPFLALITVITTVASRGSPIYRHKRVGLNGKEIYLYKFRSMRKDDRPLEDILTPEQLSEYQMEYKIDNDPRVTKLGRFLRHTSVDELAQLLNILKGDLSVIGPRPVTIMELAFYGDNADEFLSVKPGLTGYWQAYGRNDALYSTGERQDMELYYIRNHSLAFDVKIFFKTIVSVIKRRGAK